MPAGGRRGMWPSWRQMSATVPAQTVSLPWRAAPTQGLQIYNRPCRATEGNPRDARQGLKNMPIQAGCLSQSFEAI